MADDTSTVASDTGSDIGDVSLDAFNDTAETPEVTETVEETTDTTDEEQSDTAEQTPEDIDNQEETEDSEQSEETGEPAEPKLTRRERAERYAEQQQLEAEQREQVEQAYNQAYAPQTLEERMQEYVDAGYDEGTALTNARMDINEQRTQIAQAAAQVTQLNANLQVDAVEARAKYEWMNPESKKFAEGTTKAAAQLYELATVKDQRTGQIVDAKMSVSQIASVVEQIRQEAIKEAKVIARRNAESEMASVAPATSARQPVRAGNSLKDMEKRLENVEF